MHPYGHKLNGKRRLFNIPARFKDTYKIFWASRDLEKMKGSGVACIVHCKWAKHHWETVVFSPYLLNVRFLFQNLQLNVWTIYAAPSDLLILQDSFNLITEQYNLNLDKNQFHIVTGDFNKI